MEGLCEDSASEVIFFGIYPFSSKSYCEVTGLEYSKLCKITWLLNEGNLRRIKLFRDLLHFAIILSFSCLPEEVHKPANGSVPLTSPRK